MTEETAHATSVETSIHIDRKTYRVTESSLTGAQLRQLADIGPAYDLFLEVPGGEDQLVSDDQPVELKDGMHFFSIQRHINPGR